MIPKCPISTIGRGIKSNTRLKDVYFGFNRMLPNRGSLEYDSN